MIWRQNTDITHLSFNFARQTFCGTDSTYVLLKADSACQNVHKLVHDVVPQKICCARNISFWMICHFKMACPSSVFLVGLAIVRCPADTFHVELVRAFRHILYAREILRSCSWSYLAIACTIVQTIFLVGLFVGPEFDSQTRSPVFKPVVSVAYVSKRRKRKASR